MGLRASFDVCDDLGYAEETPVFGFAIDYSEGCEIFADTFLQVAQDLCPVDTGYLLSSISAYANDSGCECLAEAEYAQYVEYGTCFMGDQPYFEPALEAALSEAFSAWDDAVDEALEEEEELLEELEEIENQQQSSNRRGGGFGGKGGFIGQMITLVIVLIFLTPLFLLDAIIKDSLTPGGDSHSDLRVGENLKGYDTGIDVEII